LVTVWLTWRVGWKLTGDGLTALLAALLLALSLPFLLYSRQCQWYAPAMAVTLLLVDAEERLAERWGWLRFGAAIGLLFHLNYLGGHAPDAHPAQARPHPRDSPGLARPRRREPDALS